MLGELENETYLPPNQRRVQLVKSQPALHVSFTELLDEYLQEVRKTKGLTTMKDYRSRLLHIERFAVRPENTKKYPNIARIDRAFVLDAKIRKLNADALTSVTNNDVIAFDRKCHKTSRIR